MYYTIKLDSSVRKRLCQCELRLNLSLSSAAFDASANFSLAACSRVSVCSKSSSSWRTLFVKDCTSPSVYTDIHTALTNEWPTAWFNDVIALSSLKTALHSPSTQTHTHTALTNEWPTVWFNDVFRNSTTGTKTGRNEIPARFSGDVRTFFLPVTTSRTHFLLWLSSLW